MSKRGAKFPHRLTREWTNNRYHYYLPLREEDNVDKDHFHIGNNDLNPFT